MTGQNTASGRPERALEAAILGAAATPAEHSRLRAGRKILVLITEDWFCVSHFLPLVATLVAMADEVVVATRCSGREGEIAAAGARVRPFDLKRAALNPLTQTVTVRQIAALIRDEGPDVVHVIAMQPMVQASLALALLGRRRPRVVMHLTGLGFVGISRSGAARAVRPLALRALASALGRPGSWLIAENPEDADFIAQGGVTHGGRLTLLGGAGVDPDGFAHADPPPNDPPVVAFVGRMIRPKGVHVLVEAARLLAQRGAPISLALYGDADRDNPEAISEAQLASWQRIDGVVWHGRTRDPGAVWRACDIAVLPAISREGMPRAVLEAAASGRPLVVTDVPGCRHFVRHDIEGVIVPPADPVALADALARLAADPALRQTMGRAARERVLAGYTIAHVRDGIRAAYAGLLAEERTAA